MLQICAFYGPSNKLKRRKNKKQKTAENSVKSDNWWIKLSLKKEVCLDEVGGEGDCTCWFYQPRS